MDKTTTRVASEETIRGLIVGQEYIRDVFGLNVVLNIKDTGSTAAGTKRVSEDLIASGIDLLVGEIASSKAEIAAQVAESHQVPMLTSYATASSITRNRRFAFRVCFDHDAQSHALVKYFKSAQASKILTVYDVGQLYSVDLAKSLDLAVRSAGMESNLVAQLFPASDLKGVESAIKKFNPDIIYLPLYEEGATKVVSSILTSNLQNKAQIVGGDGWQLGSLFSAAVLSRFPEVSVSFVTHHNPDGSSALQAEFIRRYQKKFGVRPDTSGSFLAFDTMLVIQEIFKEKRKIDAEKIVSRIRGVVVKGTTGRIRFNDQSQLFEKPVFLNFSRGSLVQKVMELN